MRSLWIPVLALAGLTSACASPRLPNAAAASASVAPVPIAGYDWHLTPSEGSVYLAYGRAESDDLSLGLQCETGSGRVELTAPSPAGTREIHLESGGETERFSGQSEPSGLHEGDFLTAHAITSDPVMQRFRRLAWMARWVGGQREVYASHPGSAAQVERFFSRCG